MDALLAKSETLEDFVLTSSLKNPFLVVSEEQLVATVRAPTQEEFELQLDLVAGYIDLCESRGALMIVDFEGEMPGHGSEFVTAAFQRTAAVDGDTLAQRPTHADELPALGPLMDLRQPSGVKVLKRVMDSARTKIIWGADADLQSLVYQEIPLPLAVEPVGIVDVQLAFWEPGRRLGMQRMLEEPLGQGADQL